MKCSLSFNKLPWIVFFFMLLSFGNAQTLTNDQIDSLVNKTRQTFNVPGIAVAIVKDKQVIHAKGSPYNTHFSSYGLGFFLSDEKGYFVAEHTGGLAGMVTQVTMIADADAYLIFSLDKNGMASGIKMQAISPLTDFSFDFHDLDLKRLQGN